MEKALVTGGAGFIGSNLASALAKSGTDVTVFDNFSRKGSRHNAEWLGENQQIKIVEGDVRNFSQVAEAARGRDVIFHTAGQTAVTTSVANPREDFEINALGTFNVLEAARQDDACVVYCSTNKVYGDNVNAVPLVEKEKRYEFSGKHRNGIREDFHIDARHHTPYGVSKLVGEQYARDYGALYGIKTVVNRMSCIYGTRQFGTADQGWISHFVRAAIFNKPLTIYGNGKQVRDVLFVSDLVELFIREAESRKKLHGQAFNVGGGKENTISLIELTEELERITGRKIRTSKDTWRPADQKVYYSDISKATKTLGWRPKVAPIQGIEALFRWTDKNKNLFA